MVSQVPRTFCHNMLMKVIIDVVRHKLYIIHKEYKALDALLDAVLFVMAGFRWPWSC